jgi:hypothetical protein
MSEKTKKLFIASIITYFLPLLLAAAGLVFVVVDGWTFYVPFYMFGLPMLPALVVYFIVPIFKKHYYEKKDDPKERKLAIITTSIECGAPMIIEIIIFISVIHIFSYAPIIMVARIIYILSYVAFLIINVAFWRSFPKEEKKEA